MEIEKALSLIDKEWESDTGLLVLFRMSSDVEVARLDAFIEAVNSIRDYYQGKKWIEKHLVYLLLGFYRTLSASQGHWKVSHPEGLGPEKVYEVLSSILDVFTDDAIYPL